MLENRPTVEAKDWSEFYGLSATVIEPQLVMFLMTVFRLKSTISNRGCF